MERSSGLFVVDVALVKRHSANLSALSALNRVHALAAIKAAQHGWLGACWSCAEIVSVLCSVASLEVTLSKGHAAAALYAAHYATNRLTSAELLSYKDGARGGLEAHADAVMDTGSLGQALSVVNGLALLRPERQHAVVLGDGELQEGQVWEALMTLAHRRLPNVRVVVDRNGFQSDEQCARVKGLADLEGALRALGLGVVTVDGHDTAALERAWRDASVQVVVADTVKGHGSALTSRPVPHAVTGRPTQPWHTRVPSWPQYRALVEEQLQLVGDADILAAWGAHLARTQGLEGLPEALRPSFREEGTGKAFGARVVELLDRDPRVVVLDGDLASSGGFDGVTGHARFVEMGVSEQDMVSTASGLALAGFRPVVHTYSNFFKRACENIFIAVAQRTHLVYMGTYSGLCYHTDGKSHTSFSDVSWFRAMGVGCIDPLSPQHAAAVADFCLASPLSLYVRLRRTPFPQLSPVVDAALGGDCRGFLRRPLQLRDAGRGALFVVMGTVAASVALEVDAETADVCAVTALGVEEADAVAWRAVLAGRRVVCTVEDEVGALRSFVGLLLLELKCVTSLVSHCVVAPGPSTRTLEDCLIHHRFTRQHLESLVSQ